MAASRRETGSVMGLCDIVTGMVSVFSGLD